MMPRRLLRLASAAATAAVLCLGLAVGQAQASHYDLADIDLVEADGVEKLAALGIDDTRQLLERLLTAEGRQDTALALGVDVARVTVLAQHLELMQITGIGPRAARLLHTAGIKSAADLAKADPAKLLEQLVAVNAEHQFTGVDPDNEVVSDWVAKASSVTHALQ